MASPQVSHPEIDRVTVLSLLAVLSLLIAAYALSLRVLPSRSSSKTRVLFVWHLFDSLTHLLLEASFLYNCFYTFLPVSSKSSYIADTGSEPLRVTPPGVHFLGAADRFYGAAYGSGPTAKLWQEYARADRRWGGADLTVISLELLTVFIAGPLAAYIGYLLSRGHGDVEVGGAKRRGFSGKLAFWMVVLATGELYGGFMTFAPEWLTGSPNLDTSNWMYLWLYLTFFNMLWVVFPLWVLYESYSSLTGAAPAEEVVRRAKARLEKKE